MSKISVAIIKVMKSGKCAYTIQLWFIVANIEILIIKCMYYCILRCKNAYNNFKTK